MAQALNLNLVNNNNNNNVNHANNNCDCCGIFNNSTDLLAAKIRLATNNDQTPVTLTLEQLQMLQADLARIPQLQQSLQQKEIEVMNKDEEIIQKNYEIAQQNVLINAKNEIINNQTNQITNLQQDNQYLLEENNQFTQNIKDTSLKEVVKQSTWNVMSKVAMSILPTTKEEKK